MRWWKCEKNIYNEEDVNVYPSIRMTLYNSPYPIYDSSDKRSNNSHHRYRQSYRNRQKSSLSRFYILSVVPYNHQTGQVLCQIYGTTNYDRIHHKEDIRMFKYTVLKAENYIYRTGMMTKTNIQATCRFSLTHRT